MPKRSEHAVDRRGRDPLPRRDVLVIDEAGMIGTRQLERVLREAERAHAKVVLVGDAKQLQAIEAGAAFRGISATHGVSNLTEVRRQKAEWQRNATQDLCTANTTAALDAYQQRGRIIAVEQRIDALNALIARWAHDHKQRPDASQLVLAYTRDDVKALNTDIRTLRQQTGQLGYAEELPTETGKKHFAVNDRVRFLRNERDLGVKNGSLGTIEALESGVLSVKLDGTDNNVHIDTKFYKHIDYGYAATVHKAQGTTVDNTYVLATSHFDRHTAYVALSRHRDNATVYYASDNFGGRAKGATEESIRARFAETLSRARPKELAHDYLELGAEERPQRRNQPAPPAPPNDIEPRQLAAAERWAARQQHGPNAGEGAPTRAPTPNAGPQFFKDLELRHGPEDELEL